MAIHSQHALTLQLEFICELDAGDDMAEVTDTVRIQMVLQQLTSE
jgi:hypothetical protein